MVTVEEEMYFSSAIKEMHMRFSKKVHRVTRKMADTSVCKGWIFNSCTFANNVQLKTLDLTNVVRSLLIILKCKNSLGHFQELWTSDYSISVKCVQIVLFSEHRRWLLGWQYTVRPQKTLANFGNSNFVVLFQHTMPTITPVERVYFFVPCMFSYFTQAWLLSPFVIFLSLLLYFCFLFRASFSAGCRCLDLLSCTAQRLYC